MLDLPALERGSGRRGAGHEPVLRAHHYLPVGADVHQHPHAVALEDAGRKHRRYRVCADESGHDWKEAHHRVRGALQRQLAGGNDQRLPDHRRIGGQSDVAHVDAQKDVVHAGVAGDHDFVDMSRGDPGLPASLLDEVVDGGQGTCPQGRQLLLVELREGDSRHQVAAVDRLRVDAADRRKLLAGREIDEAAHDARGSDVERHAVHVPGGVAGFDVDDPAAERGDGQGAAALAQSGGDLADHREGNLRLDPVAQLAEDLLDVGALVVLLDGCAGANDVLLHSGVDGRRAGGATGAGRQELMAGFRLGRHRPDRAVGDHPGLAREAESLADLIVAELHGVLHRRRRDVAPEHLHAAAPAPSPRAAGSDDFNPRHSGRVQERRVGGAGDGTTLATCHVVDERHGEIL